MRRLLIGDRENTGTTTVDTTVNDKNTAVYVQASHCGHGNSPPQFYSFDKWHVHCNSEHRFVEGPNKKVAIETQTQSRESLQ